MTKQYIGGNIYDIRFQSGLYVELSEGDILELVADFEKRTIIDHSFKKDLSNAISNNDDLTKLLKKLIGIYEDKDPVVIDDQKMLMEEIFNSMDNEITDQSFNLGEVDKIIKSI